MNKDEVTLLYGFKDEERLSQIIYALSEIHIKTKILKDSDYNEKLGFLLGLKGFKQSNNTEEIFSGEEIMIFQNIKGKRLDSALEKFKESGLTITKNKAIVTPFNVHWTIKKIHEKMLEHQNVTSKN